MPSMAAIEKRKARRQEQAQMSAQSHAMQAQSQGTNGCQQGNAVDGKQREKDAECLEMQETVQSSVGHGKQSEQHQPSVTAQKTAQSEPVSAQNITEILTEIPMRRNTHKPYSKSLPATKAMIQQQIKTKYVVGTKGLSEEQLIRACATAYAEVWAEMNVVANQQYGLEFRTAFCTTVYQKACRIIESKRRRCARTKRQPKPKDDELQN